MKKVIFTLLALVLVFGFMGGVFADSDKKINSDSDSSDESDSESDSSSGSDSDDSKSDKKDEEKNEVKVKIENKGEENELKVKTEFESEDGEMKEKSEVTIKGYDEDGNEVEIELSIERRVKDGEVFEKIKVKGYEVESELEFENESGKLKVKLSNGNRSEVKIMPDTASMRAIENFESRDIKVELKEVGEGNNLSVVYEAEGNKTVKFLGLFKVKAQVRAVISAENGEVLRLDEPWWYFMAFGKGAVDCDAENLDLCDDESECVESGLIWFEDACVSSCAEEAKVCDDNVTVVYRDEALACEFSECPEIVVNETNESEVVA